MGITYLLKCYCSNCLEIWDYCKMLSNLIKIFNFLLWEPKMCRLTWQLLGMLGNVLGLLGMFRNVLGMYRSLVVHYSLGFTAYKVASGGVYLRCGTPRTLRKGMPRRPRTLQSMPRTLQSMPRRPRTLPSMPRSCQVSLHILGSHTNFST